MEPNHTNNSQNAAPFEPTRNDAIRTVSNPSEPVGSVPHDSAPFRTVRNDSEGFRTLPNPSERKNNHILTVREVARMFEAAGVARTERSIVKWCRRVGNEMPRLDSYYDPNERKYFITSQSVELAIAEEQAKAARTNSPSEPVGNVPKGSERREKRDDTDSESDSGQVQDLEKEVMDLRILNRGKDYFIEQLQKEREAFTVERQGYVEKLMSFNHRVGELETQLLQLAEPRETETRKLEVRRETESDFHHPENH